MIKINQRANLHRIVGYATSVLSSAILAYLWTVLGERGISADRTHTAGYTKNIELFLAILLIATVAASIILLYKSSKTDPDHRRVTVAFIVGLASVTFIYCTVSAFLTT